MSQEAEQITDEPQVLRELSGVQLKLFGGTLLRLDTPQLIDRYNNGLQRLGISPTSSSRVTIDARGWSPEVAVEKGDPGYLSAGPANPFALILSPNQLDMPLLLPSSSYEEKLLRRHFSQFEKQIGDVTTTDTVTIDFDIGLSRLTSPIDLLLLKQVVLRTSIGELDRHIQLQRRLVEQFEKERFAWFDRKLRAEIIASAKQQGDLRGRETEFAELEHSFSCFYTRAYSGVFVLRPLEGSVSILVLENEAVKKASIGPTHQTYTVDDARLLSALIEGEFIELDFGGYAKCPQLLEQKREQLFGHLIAEHYKSTKPQELNRTQEKRLISSLPGDAIGLLDELERFSKKISGGHAVRLSEVSRPLRALLAEPVAALDDEDANVVRSLLARIDSIDVRRMAKQDRCYLSEQFTKWSKAKQRWALHFLQQQAQQTKFEETE